MGPSKRPKDGDSADTSRKKRGKIRHEPTSRVVTRGASRRSISEAVFLTTELLENVLRMLPMKDLLLAQRVCRKWKAVIAETTMLQQALFFIPEVPNCRWRYTKESNGRSRLNKVEPTAKLERIWGRECTMDSGRLNPLLFDSNIPYIHKKDEGVIGRAGSGTEAIQYRLPIVKEAEQASWRKMLVTQPPLQKAELHYHFDTLHGRFTKVYGYRKESSIREGLTVRHVVDIARQVERARGKLKWTSVFLCKIDMVLPTPEEQDAMEEHDGKLWPES